MLALTELIARAPWREAVTYRDTWPHEYVLTGKDDQRELLAAVRDRLRAGEGVVGDFFSMNNTYLFIGEYKYWLMTHYDDIDPYDDEGDYVLNRARLYRDRRDFIVQPGDSGKPEVYPGNPPRIPAMAEKPTLLAHLTRTLTSRVEDAATEALAFILNESAECRRALNCLIRDEGFDPEPIKRFETQVTAKDGSRPDLIGYDRTGNKRLIVEVKFWANLGQRQVRGYFDQIDEESPGVLLFIAPESRRESLWKEIERQMNGKKLKRVDPIEDVRRAQIVGSKNGLMLVSWVPLLCHLLRAVADDSPTASDIQQLLGLARQQDDDKAFQPIHAEELAPSLARRIRSINRLIDDVIDSRSEELGITTGGYQRAPQQEGYGRYFGIHDVEREFFIGVNFRLWATDRNTPLWLSIGGDIEVDHEKLQYEFISWGSKYKWKYDIPIYLETGEKYQVVLDDVVSQIRRIKDAVDGNQGNRT